MRKPLLTQVLWSILGGLLVASSASAKLTMTAIVPEVSTAAAPLLLLGAFGVIFFVSKKK